MKAAVLHAKNDIRCDEIEKPRISDDEVLIKVMCCGICGSDIPRVLGDASHYYPNVLGHEFSGVVAEIGKNVKGIKIGERATAAPLLPCGKCLDCQQGNYSQCKNYKFIGSSVFGAFAEYVKVPSQNVVTFDDSVSFEQGAFFEPSTVSLHGIKLSNFHGGEDVAILGAGTIGLFAMQWCKALGAKRVVLFDINDGRLELGREMGADLLINSGRDGWIEETEKITGGKGFPFVYESAGQNATMKMAFELAANKADLCFIGTSSRDLAFPWKTFEKMNRKEFRLTGSWMSYSSPFPGDEWSKTAYYFGKNKVRYAPEMIDSVYRLEDCTEAFKRFENPEGVNGKIMFKMTED